MGTCSKCSRYNLIFSRPYEPHEFVEGDPNADVWIIGLNPKEKPEWSSRQELLTALDDEATRHKYFKDFASVSPNLKLHSQGNTAHTDLVKCHSRNWINNAGPKKEVIRNCRVYLDQQLGNHVPSVIVCNGADVSREIREIIPPRSELGSNGTHYEAEFNGQNVTVILSGFIGRIDNYAKRRLGREIEEILEKRQWEGPLPSRPSAPIDPSDFREISSFPASAGTTPYIG